METRRQFLRGAGASLLAAMPPLAFAKTTIGIGASTLTSLSDGNLVLPAGFFFDGLPKDELLPILRAHDVPTDQLVPPCNVTLLRDGTRTVLFDVGAGPGFMSSAGKLLDSLDAVDVAPEEVTHVVFTHAHPDHLWGVLDDFDDPVFTEAAYMIGQVEWDYWRNPETVNTIGDARASFAVGAARRLEAIADRITLITADQEILPGVAAVASYGHTPGHLSFEIRAGTEAVLVGGDAIGNHHVAFARPDWGSGADQDPALGAKTRQRLLDKLAQEQMTLIGFHLPGGGIGRVERQGDAYRFVTEEM
ncbi:MULTISPECIES: MBL fold metallo-hydrolase [unclassified Roseovarius]|uniref:MBL fold metallo-hydrolase n=1 Tax=unclassified Roseovarius TaxID=2614913 RepID=UPI00273EFDBE|nr:MULTISPECIES: MBL fold metallo-hydrolase [unclassified Roseovarius]